MAKIWKTVCIIALVAVIFAALSFLVGTITGGSIDRVTDLFNEQYDVEGLKAQITDILQNRIGIMPLN